MSKERLEKLKKYSRLGVAISALLTALFATSYFVADHSLGKLDNVRLK